MIQIILVDWHNLFKMCEKLKVRLEAIFGEIVQKGLANGEIQQIRLFVPCYQAISPWRVINALQCKYDLAVETCPVLSGKVADGIEMKDAVDFRVLQWVETSLHNGVGPDSVIFVTGDGHFLISGNIAKRKGKKVEFWAVDESSVHQLIRRQEEFREISLSPPILLTKENPFLETIQRLIDQQILSENDQRRLNLIVRTVRENENASATSNFLDLLSSKLEISKSELEQLIEALMALGIAKTFSANHKVIDIDLSSPLFQFLPLKVVAH